MIDKDILVFDAHMHYKGKFMKQNEGFIEFLDRFGIDKAIITTLNTSANSKLLMSLKNKQLTDKEFADKFYPKHQYDHENVKKLIDSHPNRLIGFYWFNPRIADEKDWRELTRYIREYNFKGVKTQASVDNLDPNSDLDKLAEFCIDLDIPLFFHSGTNFYFQKQIDVKDLYTFLKRYPELKLIIGHAAFTMEYMISLLRYFEPFPQVFFETSLSVPYGIKVLIKVMGEDRILYGSDSPPATTPDIEINKIKILDLPKDIQKKVFYENTNNLVH